MDYTIKTASKKDLEIILGMAKDEGWNPGLDDADSFYSADPNGFFLGYINNEPIASISAVKYGNEFGFLGLYIVKKEFRGHGFGFRIWQDALSYLKDRNIGLDGVVAQQENYKKSGFISAGRNIRFAGISKKIPFKIKGSFNIKDIPFEKIAGFDCRFFPAKRDNFLKTFIKGKNAFGTGIIQDKNIKGYGLIRKCRNSWKIGPLFAENEKYAEIIFNSLISYPDPGSKFYYDVPEVNKNSIKLAENTGMKPVFETARMYSKFIPDLPLNKIFGVTTFELG